jgi:hypothetical protein
MVSVRRIAIAVAAVAGPFVLAAVVFWIREEFAGRLEWTFRPEHVGYFAVAICAVCAIVPRLRRFTAPALAAVSVLFILIFLHLLSRFARNATPDLSRAVRDVFVLAALASAVAGRAHLLRPVVRVLTAILLTILLTIVPLLVVIPYGDSWAPPTWGDLGHLRPVDPAQLCRGVTLFHPSLKNDAYARIGQITVNFRGEHRPMVLLLGQYRERNEWLPPEALARMLVDDRDPHRRPCEGAGRHPVWPRAAETVGDQLRF